MDIQTKLPKLDSKKEEEKELTEPVEKRSDTSFFEEFLDKESLFVNKNVLMLRYLPNTIPHREGQIKQLSLILAPALRKEKPSNIFLYGKFSKNRGLLGKIANTKFGTHMNRSIGNIPVIK